MPASKETATGVRHRSSATAVARAEFPRADVSDPLLGLRHEAGNQAMQRVLADRSQIAARPAAVEAARAVDSASAEDTSSRSAMPGVEPVPRSADTTGGSASMAQPAIAGAGRPLEPALRRDMEIRFGHDFARVRIFAEAGAAQAARAVNARAYTIGSDIVMGAGRFAPATSEGRRLLAHELTHVVQAGGLLRGRTLSTSGTIDVLEAEARHVAQAIDSSLAIPPIRASAYGLAVPLLDGPDDPERPTFGNLPREEADPRAKRFLLVEKGGVWYEMRSKTQMYRAEGAYDFVVQKGKVWAVRPSSTIGGINPGHTEAAAGGRVEYAGTVRFGRKGTTRGVVQEWSNASGHYAPVRDKSFAKAPGFPLDEDLPFDKRRFKPVEDGFPSKGPQLPVQQPRTRPRDSGPPRVPAGPPQLEALEARIAESRRNQASEQPRPAGSVEAPVASKPAEPPAAVKPTAPPTVTKAADQPGTTTSERPAASGSAKRPTLERSPRLPAKIPPSVKSIAEPTTEPSTKQKPTTPATSRATGSSIQADTPAPGASAAAALQRTYGALAGRYTSKLTDVVASKDPEMGALIADMNRLLDAESFIRNPRQFSANFLASYMINGAFGKFARQLGEAEARFFSTYPDVATFSRQPLGRGMNLTTLRLSYEETARNLRIPDARKTLMTVFATLDLNENSSKAGVDRRIALIDQYLLRQPQIGTYVKKFNDAKADYAFGLALVRTRIDTLQQQLGELPQEFADDLRRRGDALLAAAKILEDFYDDMFPLNALPGASTMLYMLLQLSKGFAGLGGSLYRFADRAGGRRAEYQQEIARLELLADRLSKVRGAFDIIHPPPGR